MMKKIYISPSDQTGNTYAAGSTNEAVQCRQMAQHLVRALERCGFEAKINLTAGMRERVAESNAWGADLHVPIHTNAFDGKTSGTRLVCYSTASEGYKACQAVFRHLAPITPGTSENISAHPELYECRAATAPTLFVEADFHDVDEVALWLIDHKEDIAEAICHGICDHYGVAYITNRREESEMRYQTIADMKADKVARAHYLPTIEKLLDKGVLKGKGGSGDALILDLGEDAVRLLVILDRAGIFN